MHATMLSAYIAAMQLEMKCTRLDKLMRRMQDVGVHTSHHLYQRALALYVDAYELRAVAWHTYMQHNDDALHVAMVG